MLSRFQDVFKSLHSHKVKYVVIGGVAAVLQGVPRATFDVDILIEATPDNGKRLLDALVEAGLGTATLTDVESLLASEVTIFNDRVRIDVQTQTPGLVFEEAWARKEEKVLHGQKIFIVSKSDLVSSKKAAGRPIDLDDVKILENMVELNS